MEIWDPFRKSACCAHIYLVSKCGCGIDDFIKVGSIFLVSFIKTEYNKDEKVKFTELVNSFW